MCESLACVHSRFTAPETWSHGVGVPTVNAVLSIDSCPAVVSSDTLRDDPYWTPDFRGLSDPSFFSGLFPTYLTTYVITVTY
jgi:hypothetical protein